MPNHEQGIGHTKNVRVVTRVSRRVSALSAPDARVCAPEERVVRVASARSVRAEPRVGARGVCASVRAGLRAPERAEPAGGSGLSSWSASRGAEPSGPAGGGLVPRVAARQPSAPGGAGSPPLRWGLKASSSLSHAGAQRVLSCRSKLPRGLACAVSSVGTRDLSRV